MPKLLVQNFVHIKRELPDRINHRIAAQHFKIKAVPVEGNDARKRTQLIDEFLDVVLEPAPKLIVLIPSNRHRNAKLANVPPSAVNFMRKPQRLNVEINFPSEEVH